MSCLFRLRSYKLTITPFIRPREACIVCACVCVQEGNTGQRRGQESLASIGFKPLPGQVRVEVRDKGAEYQKQARTRCDRITEAYEAIKKQRGIK